MTVLNMLNPPRDATSATTVMGQNGSLFDRQMVPFSIDKKTQRDLLSLTCPSQYLRPACCRFVRLMPLTGTQGAPVLSLPAPDLTGLRVGVRLYAL